MQIPQLIRQEAKWLIATLIASALILLPLIFFPLSGDLALFEVAARMMKAGGVPYHDFLDIKTPILFYLFRLLTDLFGSGEYGVRLFDYIIQLGTVGLIFHTMRKVFDKNLPAAASGILYSIVYITLNFNNTTQIESLYGFAAISVIYLHVFHRNRLWSAGLIGMLVGIFTGMKYTLGITLAAMLLDDAVFCRMPKKELNRKYFACGLGFGFTFGLTLLPYLNGEILAGYKNLQPYFSFYTAQPGFNLTSLRYVTESLITYFGDIQSLSVMVFFIFGVIYMLRSAGKSEQYETLRFAFLLCFALYFACGVERKFFIYHLSRANVPFMMLAGAGVYSIFEYLRSSFSRDKSFTLTAAIFVGLLFIPLSPLPRFFDRMLVPYLYLTDQTAYNAKFSIPGDAAVIRSEHINVANFVNSRLSSGDKVINASTGSSFISYLLNTDKQSKFLQSSYFVYPGADIAYLNDFADELRHADFLIIQKNDHYFHVNGTQTTSHEAIFGNPVFASIIRSRYTKILDTPSFDIRKAK